MKGAKEEISPKVSRAVCCQTQWVGGLQLLSGPPQTWGADWLWGGLWELVSAWPGARRDRTGWLGKSREVTSWQGGGVCTLPVDLHRQAAEAVHPPEKSDGLLQGRALQGSLEEGLGGLTIHLQANHRDQPLWPRVLQLQSECRRVPHSKPTRLPATHMHPAEPLSQAVSQDELIQLLQTVHTPTPRANHNPSPIHCGPGSP